MVSGPGGGHLLSGVFLQKHPSPEDWLYKEARGLFLNPEVVDCSSVELKWSEPDEDGLVQFMCDEKQFRYVNPREETMIVL